MDENKFKPYSCGFYDGKNSYMYYLTDFDDCETMFRNCFQDMVTPKYHNYTVYCHNMAKFDGILVSRVLHKYFNVNNIVSKELNVISLNVKDKIKRVKYIRN